VTPRSLRAHCLRLAGAEETFPFGPTTAVFKVGGKIFAISGLDADDLHISVKVEPELGERLRASYPEIRPGYHLNKRHWITIDAGGGLEDRMVRDLVEDSWALVASQLPRAARMRLGIGASVG
jgi:predicted DNA-binding protein (MmcQ/YjbR family)